MFCLKHFCYFLFILFPETVNRCPSYLLLSMVVLGPALISLDKPVSFHAIRGMC